MQKIKGAHRQDGRQRRKRSRGKIMLRQHRGARENRKDPKGRKKVLQEKEYKEEETASRASW